MPQTDYLEKFANYVVNARFEQLPPPVVLHTKYRILDYCGVSIAGYKLMPFARSMTEYVASMGGKPEATIIGQSQRVPAACAALANGACAHALDMDDGHMVAGLHLGAAVISAALASAEMSGASGKDLIASVVAGYDLMARIGAAIYPTALLRGFHPTGLVSPFGAAAAAARILKLDASQTAGALSLSGQQGAGINEVIHDEQAAQAKALHPAKGAQAGIISVMLAQKGIRGPEHILEGHDGFLRAVSDEIKYNFLLDNLGETYEISNTYIKFYASCAHTHASIWAAETACKNGKINPADIDKIEIKTYPIALRICGVVTHPTSQSLGRFSMPFSVALALIRNGAGIKEFTPDAVNDQQIQDLAGKVTLSVSPRWEKEYPGKRGASVNIVDKKGNVGRATLDYRRAANVLPEDYDDVEKKFLDNASTMMSADNARRMKDIIMNIDDVSLDEFYRLFSATSSGSLLPLTR